MGSVESDTNPPKPSVVFAHTEMRKYRKDEPASDLDQTGEASEVLAASASPTALIGNIAPPREEQMVHAASPEWLESLTDKGWQKPDARHTVAAVLPDDTRMLIETDNSFQALQSLGKMRGQNGRGLTSTDKKRKKKGLRDKSRMEEYLERE
jgi:hypothetical protein